jgi:sialate O-acetylesterase
MVIQQEAAVPVQGEAAPGAEITVSFIDKTYRATADSNGAWRLFLDSRAPGGPYAMEITACGGADEKIVLDDIYVGDVWLCSGQSNMELPMQRIKDNFPEEWQPPINALIRQFKVPQEWDFSGPRGELSGGCWKAANAQTLDEFSGTAWFFARALYEKHPIPIGLINAAWGGTPVEAWMSREALAASAAAPFPAKIAMSEPYADDAKRAETVRANEAAIKEWEDNTAAADRGLSEKWQNPQTDIAAWNDITLPDNFAGTVPAHFCGAIWLRREFDVSGEFAAEESRLWMGTIVDADTAYVNGVEVGNTPYRYPPCKYVIPAGLLHAGKNHIVVRVICRDGEGGVTKGKAFRVFSEKGSIELGGTWKYRIGASVPARPAEFFLQRQPMCLFNAMIAPVLQYPFRGVIWYQGESNDPNPHEYESLFRLMINDWRAKSEKDFPFLLVQLPIFGKPEDNNEESSWAIIREAQAKALSLPATGMAAGLELAEWNDLHPLNKKDIGRRLALAAEKVVYQAPNTSPGPLVRAIERRTDRLFISFNNCGKGLTADGQLYVSVVAGENVFRLPADIEGPDCIAIDISTIKDKAPEKVLYAWANNPRDRQLYNADGLPAIPYRLPIPNIY